MLPNPLKGWRSGPTFKHHHGSSAACSSVAPFTVEPSQNVRDHCPKIIPSMVPTMSSKLQCKREAASIMGSSIARSRGLCDIPAADRLEHLGQNPGSAAAAGLEAASSYQAPIPPQGRPAAPSLAHPHYPHTSHLHNSQPQEAAAAAAAAGAVCPAEILMDPAGPASQPTQPWLSGLGMRPVEAGSSLAGVHAHPGDTCD